MRRKWDNSQGSRITKNDSIRGGGGAVLQLKLGRWKKASCLKVVNNVVSTGLMRAYHLTVLGIHSCNPWKFIFESRIEGSVLPNLQTLRILWTKSSPSAGRLERGYWT